MLLKIILITSLMWFSESYSMESTPVLTWTLNSSYAMPGDVSSLRILHPNKFEAVLTDLIQQQYHLLVFVEEFLDVEDFSTKDVNGNNIFLHTQRTYANHSTGYFPHVHEPSTALKAVSQKYLTQELFVVSPVNNEWKNIVVKKVAEGDTNATITYLENGTTPQSRMRSLQNHDRFINEVCNAVLHIRNTVCLYLGFHPFKAAELVAESQREWESFAMRSRRSADEISVEDVLRQTLGRNFSSGEDRSLEKVDLASYDTPLTREDVEVEGHKGSCDHDCTFEAESPDAAISVHLATAPTLWYDNREFTLKDFETSMIIINDSHVTLKVETPEATLHFHFVVLSDNNWVLTGVNLAMNETQTRADTDEPREKKKEEIFLFSDTPIVGRTRRQFHCQLNSFTGQTNDSRAAILYLYKMTINLRFLPDDPDWFLRAGTRNTSGNITGNVTGIDYCIPFANAAVLTSLFIVSTMIVLAMAGIGMLMSAKGNDKWDTQAQRVLVRES